MTEQQQQEQTTKDTHANSKKRIIAGAVAVLVSIGIIAAVSGLGQSTPADSQGQPETQSVSELSPKDKMRQQLNQMVSNGTIFGPGSYAKGDIPAGEYVFMPMSDDGSYYSEEDEAGSIIDNENFDSFGYVYVHGAGNISVDGALIPLSTLNQLDADSPREIYGLIKEKGNYMDSGYYKIGTDLLAGEYTIQSYGEGYVEVASGPVGNGQIVDNEIVNGSHSVVVTDGQYLKVSRGFIVES